MTDSVDPAKGAEDPYDEAAPSYTMDRYDRILAKAKDLSYWLPQVRDVAFGVAEGRFFLIRHDVDITPWAALEMAEFEHARGVHTTYYYRFHAPTYNLMAEDVIESVKRVASMGHEVGLHYEPGYWLSQEMDPVEGTRREIVLFEELIGRKTQTIAQHQPAQGPLLEEIDPAHPCAYQRALVRDLPYFGDSGFHWREGCIITKLGLHEQLHTLIHPHSWTRQAETWQGVLRVHAGELGGRLSAELEDYIHSVELYLEKREEIDRAREAQYGDGD